MRLGPSLREGYGGSSGTQSWDWMAKDEAGTKQAYALALLLLLVALGMEALVTSSQAAASTIPGTANQAKGVGQLPQGGGMTGVRDQVVFQDHVSVIVCRMANSAGSPIYFCEKSQ